MGVSTDAILAYGYDLGDYPELPWLSEDDEDESLGDLLQNRLLESLVGFTDRWSKGDETYFQRKREAEEKMGLEIIYHCSGDYPMYFLAIKGTEIRAWRGSPVRVHSLQTDIIDPEWDTRLNVGIASLGLDQPKENPGWYLFSMWG